MLSIIVCLILGPLLNLERDWQPISLLVLIAYSTTTGLQTGVEWLDSSSLVGARDLNIGPHAATEGALTS